MSDFFSFWPTDGYDFVVPVGDPLGIVNLFRENNGRAFGANWPQPIVEIVNVNRGKKLKQGDFIIGLWGYAIMFRQSVLDHMGEMLEKEGEILGLGTTSGEKLYLLNPTFCNCLIAHGCEPPMDLPKGTPARWHDWWVFDVEKCGDRNVIVVPEQFSRTFVSSAFVDCVEMAGFSGVFFESIDKPTGDPE